MEKGKKQILLVDDEPELLAALSEFLGLDSDIYRVLTASGGQEALDIINKEDIYMVVSDIQMPQITGLHLLTEIRALHPHIRVILMTGYGTDAIQREAEQKGCLHFLNKPFQVEHLRNLIRDEIDRKSEGFMGTLENIQLVDLIQMCCMSSVDMTLLVTQGGTQGHIFIEGGEIVHASCENIEGEEAFYRILSWENGRFSTLGEHAVPNITIDKPWQALIMDAMRMVDEMAEAAETPDKDPPPSPQPLDPPSPVESPTERAINLLIVDDSAMMCRMLSQLLENEEDIGLIETARNGEEALEKIDSLQPDVITLDVNMPVMDGSTALKHIMIRNPCPVIIVSSLTPSSGANILNFLQLGALDFISKPVGKENLEQMRDVILEKVRQAAQAHVNNFKRVRPARPIDKSHSPSDACAPCDKLVVINSGTGGYAELIKLVPMVSNELDACLLLLQNMSGRLITSFADYLDQRSPNRILPLDTDVPITAGHGYLGARADHISLQQRNGGWVLTQIPDAESTSEAPGFDDLMMTIAETFSGKVLVVLLSGSQIDRLDGLKQIRKQNGTIIAQQRESCMVPDPLERVINADLVDMENRRMIFPRPLKIY